MDDLIEALLRKDNQAAYSAMQRLEALSLESNAVYRHFDTFAGMLKDTSSYVRTRGFILIAANAVWDSGNKINGIIGRILSLIEDDKPVTVRQCIKALPGIIRHKPELIPGIRQKLLGIDYSKYNDSMQPLIAKDAATILEQCV